MLPPLVLLICLLATGSGCTVFQLAHRTLYRELAEYPRVTDGRLACRQYQSWARREWRTVRAEYPDTAFSSDYASGFIQGFTDYVYAGGDVKPPPIPPRRYWRIGYRNPRGDDAVQDWFAGFEHGARTARDGGYRDRATVPLPLLASLGQPTPMVPEPADSGVSPWGEEPAYPGLVPPGERASEDSGSPEPPLAEPPAEEILSEPTLPEPTPVEPPPPPREEALSPSLEEPIPGPQETPLEVQPPPDGGQAPGELPDELPFPDDDLTRANRPSQPVRRARFTTSISSSAHSGQQGGMSGTAAHDESGFREIRPSAQNRGLGQSTSVRQTHPDRLFDPFAGTNLDYLGLRAAQRGVAQSVSRRSSPERAVSGMSGSQLPRSRQPLPANTMDGR